MIRKATSSDAQPLAVLSGQLGYPASPEEVRGRIDSILGRDDHAVFVQEKAGEVVGWIHILGKHLLESAAHAEIGGLVVDQAHRGQGAGGELLRAAEEWATGRGYSAIRVRSNVVRGDAHRFYEARGFELSKRQAVFAKPLEAMK